MSRIRALLGLFVFGFLVIISAGCSKQARVDRAIEKADKYFAAKEYDKARIEYLNAIRLDPSQARPIIRVGAIYFEKKDARNAYPFLMEGKKLAPGDLDNRLKLGTILLANLRHADARKEALEVIRIDPKHSDGLLLFSDASHTPETRAEAREILLGIRQQAGPTAALYLALGNLALKDGDRTTAATAFAEAEKLDPKYPTVHLAKANLFLVARNIEQAKASLKTAADLSPVDSTARLRWVQFIREHGSPEEAKAALKEINEKEPDFTVGWMYQAQFAFQEKKWEESEQHAKQVLQLDPRHFEARLLMAKLGMAKTNYADATRLLEQLRSEYRNAPIVCYYLALAQLRNQETDKAIARLKEAIELWTGENGQPSVYAKADPKYVEAVLLLADLNTKTNDPEAAITALNKVLKDQTNSAPAYLLLASAYRKQGSWDNALGAYGKLKELLPKDPQITYLMGVVKLQKGDRAGARSDLEASLATAPDNVGIHGILAEMDLQEKKFEAALERVQMMIAKAPQSPEPWFLQGKIHLRQKANSKAEEALGRAIALDAGHRGANLLLAEIYVETQRHSEALGRLQSALAKDPKDVGTLFQIGAIHEMTKDFPKARDAYQDLLKVDPKFGPALNNLAYLYLEKLGNLDQAFEYAGRAMALAPQQGSAADAWVASTLDTMGWIRYRRGEYRLALPLLLNAAEKMGDHPELLFHLGMAHYVFGQEERAAMAFRRALELDASFSNKEEVNRRLRILGIDASKAGEKEIAELEQAVATNKDDVPALLRLRAIYERTGAEDKAREALDRAYAVNTNAVPVLIQKGVLHAEKLGDSKGAIEFFKTARAQEPNNVQLTHHLGRAVVHSGDARWGLSLLQETERQDPNQPGLAYDLGWAFYKLGMLPRAEEAMSRVGPDRFNAAQVADAKRWSGFVAAYKGPVEKIDKGNVDAALKESPDYLPALILLGRWEEGKGNLDAAREIYERIHKANPYFALVLKHLAVLLEGRGGEDSRASDYGQRAREILPQDPELSKALGKIAFRRKDYSRAGQLLGEASSGRPEDAELFYYLGMAQEQMKDKQGSRSSLERSLALNPSSSYSQEIRKILETPR